jgi:hypothetical protein
VTSFRCTLAARARADEAFATAPPARRFLLLEVPGAWGVPDAVAAAGLRPDVADAVRHRAGAAAARVVLIRRPGRHPAAGEGEPRRWATVRLDVPGVPGRVTWGTWTGDDDLLAVDPANPPAGAGDRTAEGTAEGAAEGAAEAARPLALVCTHGRHDVCCAIEGRPVAALAAADPRVDVWECSHLGGDRFAANVLWLPSGLLLGGVTAATTAATLAAVLAGRVPLESYRGRCGDSAAAQAAQWFVMRELGVDHPDLVVVESLRGVPPVADGAEPHVVAVVRHGERRLRAEVAPHWTEPHRLTCRGPHGAQARTWRLVALDALAAAS